MGTNDAKPITNRNSKDGPRASGKYAAALHRETRKSPVRWSDVDGPSIKAAVHAVTAAGDAITFGRTTDGGALSVTVLSGPDRLKDYANDAEQAADLLVRIMEAANS